MCACAFAHRVNTKILIPLESKSLLCAPSIGFDENGKIAAVKEANAFAAKSIPATGVLCKDGVVLAVENSVTIPLHVKKRCHTYYHQTRGQRISLAELVENLDDFEKKAHSVLEKSALDYYRSGAGEQFTLNLNREAFRRIRIRPRFLRDVSNIDTRCNVLGIDLKWPLGIAPSAMQKLAHPEGEGGNARAAGNAGSIYILSTLSTMSIEEVAAAAPNTNKWFQLYVYKDRSLTEQMVQRAEKANFKAIVLTIDAPIFGQRRSDVRNKFSLPPHLRLANFEGIKADSVRSDSEATSGINAYVSSQFDATLTWKDVAWLVNLTRLPVIVKGVLTREDAVLAREFGCAGIIVSNHGARQIDTVPASIEALSEVVKAVGNDLVVMLDGGVTQGNDIFKALALGAKMVFVGRAALWGLACDGQKGVEDMLSVLKKDLEITLALAGCQKLRDISGDMVAHESTYAKL